MPSRERISNEKALKHSKLARLLADAGRSFYQRGWVLGTSGNFSAVLSREPLRLAITASGVDKGSLKPRHILQIDSSGGVIKGRGRPSDESKLHLTVVRMRDAGAVLHTHSVWGTLLTDSFFDDGELAIEGFEMLKGLAGVRTHEHRERVPIIENSQDMDALSRSMEQALARYGDAHAVLLRRHGLYTWGRDLDEAARHTEILEFLLEVLGRKYSTSRHHGT